MSRWRDLPFYATALGLGALLTLEWLPAGGPPPVKPAAPPHSAAAAGNGEAAKDTDGWSASILARPLFSMGRHPAKAPGGPHLAASGMPRLSGIMISRRGRWAIFAPDGGKPLVLTEGAMLEDGTIRAIKADQVIIGGPKGEQVLRLAYDHGKQLSGGTPTPGQPNFAAGFPNPGFNPAFPGAANFQLPQGLPRPPPADSAAAADAAAAAGDDPPESDDGTAQTPAVQGMPPMPPMPPRAVPSLPFSGPRGPMIPRERQ